MNRGSLLRRGIALVLIIGGLAIIGSVAYFNSIRVQQPIFSRNYVLSTLWDSYKKEYLEPSSGRTLDKQRNNLTTSEGESYTLLRAVWQDDRATFDRSLTFTKDVLGRKTDSLFAWQFGKLSNGSYGVLTDQGGNNTASDADSDIALALIFASQRWQEQKYLTQAKAVVGDIWDQEVITVNNRPLLVANNLEKANADTVIVNPSYFSPAAYRIFAKIDDKHDWNALADSSYTWIEAIRTAPALGDSDGLPPDWVRVQRASGEIVPPGDSLTTQFGYEAMRLPWRLALDATWNNSTQAKTALAKMSFLKNAYNAGGKIMAIYAHNGTAAADYEATPAIYGGISGYFKVADSEDYERLYNEKLKSLYNPDTQTWRTKLSYYDDNWAWFGLALHENALVDLSKK